MVMRKVTLSAFLLICPWLATADDRQQQQGPVCGAGQSIEELRRQCEDFRGNSQIKEFELSIACSGHYSFWENSRGSFALRKEGHMHAHTSTKGGRFETIPSEQSKPMVPQTGVCAQHFKREMSVPGGLSLPIKIQDCSELTVANIHHLCEDEVHDYCDDNFIAEGELKHVDQSQQQQQQQQQRSSDGMCVLKTVDSFDTCPAYKN